jgi:hypothetical protein
MDEGVLLHPGMKRVRHLFVCLHDNAVTRKLVCRATSGELLLGRTKIRQQPTQCVTPQ